MKATNLVRVGAATLAATTALVLGACGGGSNGGDGDSGGKDGEKVIQVWSWYRETEDQWPAVIKEFEDSHPGVKIETRFFGNTDDYSPALTAAISAGETPEIYAPHFGVRSLGEQGVSAELHGLLGDEFLSKFNDAINQQFSSGDKQYAFGLSAQAFGLFYDPAIIEKIGVDIPETWDDLVAIAPKIKAAGYVPLLMAGSPTYQLADFVGPLITQASDDPELLLHIDLQDEGYTWDAKPVADSLVLLKKLWDSGVLGESTLSLTYEQALTDFASGKAAFFWSGSWTPQQLTMNYPDAKFEVAKQPAWKSGAKHWTGDQAGMALAISDQSPNRDIAAEFVKFLFEPERYLKFTNGSLGVPTTKEGADQVEDPILKTMTQWLVEGEGAPHILYGDGSMSALSDGSAGVLDGSLTPEAAPKEIQRLVEEASSR